MPKRWHAFSVHALVAGVSALAPLLALATVDLSGLPTWEIAPVNQTVEYRVGDRIVLRWNDGGAPLAKLKPVPIPEPSATPLLKQGWVFASPEGDDPPRTFVVSPVQPGELTLPSFFLQDEKGEPIARTGTWKANVASSIAPSDPKPEEVNPPRGAIRLPLPLWVWIVAGLLLLGLVALGIFLILRWNKRTRDLPAMPVIQRPQLAEHEEALQALDEIERAGLAPKGEFKRLYFGVSEIMKRYVGRRFEMDALESTSDEILRTLDEARAANDRDLDKLETLLKKMDIVKFTDQRPDHDEAIRLVSEARTWVRNTRRGDAPG